jgi:molybdopterin synthase sulfur carrier subunit
MAVRVVFLGPLRDLAGAEHLELSAPLDWATLLEAMPAAVSEQLRTGRVRVACAGHVVADKTALLAQDGEEVALLPPVSGG